MLRTPIVAAVVLAAVAAPAAARAPRTAVAEYVTAGGVSGDVLSGDSDLNGTRYGSATLQPRRGETRLLEVVVTDDAGLPVAFQIGQDLDGDGGSDEKSAEFCGKVTEPIRLKAPSRPVRVYVLAGPCAGGVSAPTTGTVTARLA